MTSVLDRESSDIFANFRLEFDDVKSEIPPHIMTDDMSELTVFDYLDSLHDPEHTCKDCMRQFFQDKMPYDDLHSHYLHLLHSIPAIISLLPTGCCLKHAFTILNIDSTERLLANFYTWSLTVEFPPNATCYEKLDIFIEAMFDASDVEIYIDECTSDPYLTTHI